MSARDLIEGEALLDDEEDDESFDEETGESRRKTNGTNGVHGFHDSSEDDDDDDDEEEARAVREGFIVDEEDDAEDRLQRKRERKKRRREEQEPVDEALDEEDLYLIGEKVEDNQTQESRFKRLKRGHKEDTRLSHGLPDIFNSDDEEAEVDRRPDRRGAQDEFEDFIEEDTFSDEEREREQDDEEVARPTRKGVPGYHISDASGLTESALDDLREAFGDGSDYYFALEKEEEEQEQDHEQERHLDLKDVFEPSQLVEKMLTDEDNRIRHTDEPERFQLARKPYKNAVLTPDQFKDEAAWISKLLFPKRRIQADLHGPFQEAIGKVLDFMVTEDYEVPFIFQHRKDYLIHSLKRPVGRDEHGNIEYEIDATKLLLQSDLWEIFDLDLKYRALVDKRNTLQKTYDNLVSMSYITSDTVFNAMLPAATSMEELQDVQDYLHFQYSADIKDMNQANAAKSNGDHQYRRKAISRTLFERVRNSKASNLVRAYGISADDFAENALNKGVRNYTEDPTEQPDDMADSMVDSDFPTGSHALKVARMMFTEELVMSPKMRKVVREYFYESGIFDCFRTEKGLKKIDEQHPDYEFKYLRNQDFSQLARQPELFLRMLKAEEEGFVEVKMRLLDTERIREKLHKQIESDNFSEVADAWNKERRAALDEGLARLSKIMARSVKEHFKLECENAVAKICREAFSQRLDQAPLKPPGMKKGTTPRVLTLSNGTGIIGRDPISWAYVSDEGHVEIGTFTDLVVGDKDRDIQDGKDVAALVEVVQRRGPDAIGISGFSPETRKLHQQVRTLVDKKDLRGPVYQDEYEHNVSDLLDVVIVNDEIARLYQTSDRAGTDHPGFAPLTHYCIALGKFMQDPLKEYASLGRDLTSIIFTQGQQLLPQEKVLKSLETVLVDYVNLVGVDLSEAVNDTPTARLLPFVAGLGPRKAVHLLKVLSSQGELMTREDLLGVKNTLAAMGPKVWSNCASFLFLPYENTEPESEPLDNTRIHPEDYDIARKMAADALELDEEDIKAEVDENGVGAIVRKLFKDDAQDRVNDLILEQYAEQLETISRQRKRATLETIRAELNDPYEELRNLFVMSLSTEEVFTMFTGETKQSLHSDMIVPMSIKRITDDHIDGKLDCGIDVIVGESELSDDYSTSVKSLYSLHQTVSVKLMNVDRKNFSATASLREEMLKRPYRRYNDHMHSEWDDRQEVADKKLLEEKTDAGGRAMRVIKHPLFRPFTAKQAEEYLGSQNRGDVVIRPSSRGNDHLAVTWKVADGVYQHIDVLELDKENEFALGKTLKIAGRYTYSDLDELIVNHVRAMAKKVDEITLHDKYRNESKNGTEDWLTTYAQANPKRSNYAFCLNREFPGYFHLCFKAGEHGHPKNWPVKVIPQGFELQKNPYPSMRDLTNGFKLLYQNMQAGVRR